jgi:putative endonuclease
MTKKSELGKLGEDLAVGYFTKLGWKVVERNVRVMGDELDIVAIDKNKILVLVEVKTMRSAPKEKIGEWLTPEDQLSSTKLSKFKRGALKYVGCHPELINKNGFRLDALTIEVGDTDPIFHYYENL